MWGAHWTGLGHRAGLGQVLEPDRVRLRFSNRPSSSTTAHTQIHHQEKSKTPLAPDVKRAKMVATNGKPPPTRCTHYEARGSPFPVRGGEEVDGDALNASMSAGRHAISGSGDITSVDREPIVPGAKIIESHSIQTHAGVRQTPGKLPPVQALRENAEECHREPLGVRRAVAAQLSGLLDQGQSPRLGT